ncbi:uncharacterized protein LOC112052328 [Bicyclus anynana]|uniref:Uncharacterized protein LOC112052328 n=1 Tax=Bicyclus anynana TaxID=110368 RepID=A0A6J1NJL1_BICAN|nr:uncharacterized protein LOC112052328 [Bicyclus anynana]
MASSDSEDGYYSNAAKKMRLAREQLKKLQSTDVEEIKCGAKTKEENSKVNVVNNSIATQSVIDPIDDDLIIDEIIAKNSKPTPKLRRGRKTKEISPETVEPVTKIRGRGRGRGSKRARGSKNNVTNSNQNSTLSELLNTGQINTLNTIQTLASRRGRGRRGRRGRGRSSFSPDSSIEEIMQELLPHFMGGGRGCQIHNGTRSHTINNTPSHVVSQISQMYPTYSVGNTDEYPDKSDDIPLFSKPSKTTPDEVVLLDDDDDTDNLDNEPLSVKVTWRSQEIFKFTIRKYQKLTQIFETFSKKENVEQDKLLFTYNNKILTQNDTPASIDYNIAKFIDGGVVSHSVKPINRVKIVNGIKIKFQCQNVKKPIEVTIGSNDKLLSAMTECAEHLKVPVNKLKFEFDGDIVAGTHTPQQLDLENGDCIDVKIIN